MSEDSDRGWTRLRGGRRVRKDHPLVCVGGELDELNCVLGAASAALGKGRAFAAVQATLLEVQHALLAAGCGLGSPAQPGLVRVARRLSGSAQILSRDLAPLSGFILPGGSAAGAWLHLARAVCRRAERAAAALPHREGLSVLLNRLSGWLFCAARWVNERQGRPEVAQRPQRR